MTDEKKLHTPWELFGVECGRGWSWIVVALLQAALDRGPYSTYSNETGETIFREGGVYITQIKEKFGGLRFYYCGGDDEFDQLVQQAEDLAYKTCETCGEPGRMRGRYWLQTLCDKHAEGYEG